MCVWKFLIKKLLQLLVLQDAETREVLQREPVQEAPSHRHQLIQPSLWVAPRQDAGAAQIQGHGNFPGTERKSDHHTPCHARAGYRTVRETAYCIS